MRSIRKLSENPFHGKKAMMELYRLMQSNSAISNATLDAAYLEAKESKTLLEGFFSILFAIGDITDRSHNIFKGRKVDGGGYANREAFFKIREWMESRLDEQHYKMLLPLIVEYSGWDALLASRVRTAKRKKWSRQESKVVAVVTALKDTNLKLLAEFISEYITNEKDPFKLALLAKRLVRINNRTSSRPEVQANRMRLAALYDQISLNLNWEIQHVNTDRNQYFVHKGLYEWKRPLIHNFESVLFSTKRIEDFDQVSFCEWLDHIPSDARRRVLKRLKGQKWGKLMPFYAEWQKTKEKAQAEKRKLEAAKAEGHAIDEAKLAELKKVAKVTTGASNILTELENMLTSRDASDFNLRADSLLDKIRFEVPVLPIIDTSSSMNGNYGQNLPKGITPMDIAWLLATVVGLKNPLNEGIFFTFDSVANVYSYNAKVKISNNRFMEGKDVTIRNLIDRKKTFLENYNTMRMLRRPVGTTVLTSVSKLMAEWAGNDPSRKEMISNYPVFLVISDGYFNNEREASESVRSFMHSMRTQFGWDGVLAIWDVHRNGLMSNFQKIENVVHFAGWTASIADQIFRNIHDLEVIDVYTPLWSIQKSSRYEPVRTVVSNFVSSCDNAF